jgi:hypothetical protein
VTKFSAFVVSKAIMSVASAILEKEPAPITAVKPTTTPAQRRA